MNTKSDRSLSIEHSAIYFEAGDNHCQVVINNARTSFHIRSNLSWVQSESFQIFFINIQKLAFQCARCAPSNLGRIVFHLLFIKHKYH